MDLISVVKKHLVKERRGRYRDRRGHYASSALSCRRDQYWSIMGEPETNSTDFVGKMKMLVGTAVEVEFVKTVLADLHWYQIHLIGTQVTVGSSNPAWDGALDALVSKKQEDGSFKNYVIEIKTKSGYGADLLADSCEPSQEYLAQLGLYLKDLDKKGITNEGCLLYILLSDRHFGEVLQVSCSYDKQTDEITASFARSSSGTEKRINHVLRVGSIEERWKELDEAIKNKVVPKPDYQYKYPLTQEFLSSLSENMIRKMINGERVMGDWNVAYSRYKDLQLATDKVAPGYTEEELGVIRAFYRKLHPKSKL